MAVKDGGQAFPHQRRISRMGYDTDEFEPAPGMTLRDVSAAAALEACVMTGPDLHQGQCVEDRIATHCWKMADAMLRNRNA